MSTYGCNAGKTFAQAEALGMRVDTCVDMRSKKKQGRCGQAEAICAAKKLRSCTQAEITAGKTSGVSRHYHAVGSAPKKMRPPSVGRNTPSQGTIARGP